MKQLETKQRYVTDERKNVLAKDEETHVPKYMLRMMESYVLGWNNCVDTLNNKYDYISTLLNKRRKKHDIAQSYVLGWQSAMDKANKNEKCPAKIALPRYSNISQKYYDNHGKTSGYVETDEFVNAMLEAAI